MKNIEDWKYKNTPLESVVNDYGYVTDVEFAKYLISCCYAREARESIRAQEWVEECQSRLEVAWYDDEFSMINQSTGRISLGGPDGLSGITFQLLEKRLENDCPEDNEDVWDLGFESSISWDRICVVLIGGKPRAFISHEAD